jgi:hypothetical protein
MSYETFRGDGEDGLAKSLIAELLELSSYDQDEIVAALTAAQRKRNHYPPNTRVVDCRVFDPSGTAEDLMACAAFAGKDDSGYPIVDALNLMARTAREDLIDDLVRKKFA